jgi:hypothetical protein
LVVASPEDGLAVSERVPVLAYAVDDTWPFDPAGILATARGILATARGILATARDRRSRTGAAVSCGVDAWSGTVRTLSPKAAGEAVTDNLFGPPHDAHADHKRHGSGQEPLYEDGTPV